MAFPFQDPGCVICYYVPQLEYASETEKNISRHGPFSTHLLRLRLNGPENRTGPKNLDVSFVKTSLYLKCVLLSSGFNENVELKRPSALDSGWP